MANGAFTAMCPPRLEGQGNMREQVDLPDVVVTNMHRRFTGVSATVAALVPHQQATRPIAVIDAGNLGLSGTVTFWQALLRGWSTPKAGNFRIWHARRDVEMLAGLFLRYVLRQPWKLVFTSAAPKRHGATLRWIINRMDAVVATSSRTAGYLDWHSVVINHGVDTGDFTPPADKVESFSRSGLPGKYAIGSFGRIRASKGSDLFVGAMVRLLPSYPEFTAVLTGLSRPADQEFKQKLEQQIADAGLGERVVFLGDLSEADIRSWYQRCLICVAASRREGFGLTPMEAMASGAIAVTSEAGFWPELIKPGINGAIFETGSEDALVAALEPLLSDPRRCLDMGMSARQDVVDHHSITDEASAINALYDRLATGDVPRIYGTSNSAASTAK